MEVATGGRSLIFLDLIRSVSTLISLSGSCNNIIDSCLDINTKPFFKHVLFLLSVQKKDFFARHNDKVIANQFAEPWWHEAKARWRRMAFNLKVLEMKNH